MKDYTQENYDRLCAALTMDELANFMDCIPFAWIPESMLMQLGSRYHSPSESLNLGMVWHKAPHGHEYWSSIRDKLAANEA